MKDFNNKWLLAFILITGALIGTFRGAEAKQKWVFKMKNRCEEKRHMAEEKKVLRSGGVALDDIEIAAFHKS